MALVVEKQRGAAQGNANPNLYARSNGAHNPFHATQAGDNSVPGVTGFIASGATYNLATGLGSVDAAVAGERMGLERAESPNRFAAGSLLPLQSFIRM